MIVLDAAALVDIVASRPNGTWALDRIDGEDLNAPAHQLAEVVSAVARLHRAGELSRVPVDVVRDAAALPQTVHPIDEDLALRALELRDRIRVVDGLYVALAERLGVPLVTTDRRLVAAQPPCVCLGPEGSP